MPLFSRNYDRPGPGVSKEKEPRPWYAQFFVVYFRKFWKLVQLNLLFLVPFLLTAGLMVALYFLPGHVALQLEGRQLDLWTMYVVPLPLILLSPFVAGLTVVTRNFAREEHAFLWWDSWDAIKKNWKAFLLNGLLCYAVYAILSFAMIYYYLKAGSSQFYYVPFGFALVIAVLFVWMQFYVPVMIITFDLKLRQIYRNGAIFIAAGFWRNLVISAVLAALVVGAAVVPISVLSLPFLLALVIFWLFSFLAYLVNFMVYPVIDQYLIQPQTAQPEEDEEADEDHDDPDELVYYQGKMVKRSDLPRQGE